MRSPVANNRNVSPVVFIQRNVFNREFTGPLMKQIKDRTLGQSISFALFDLTEFLATRPALSVYSTAQIDPLEEQRPPPPDLVLQDFNLLDFIRSPRRASFLYYRCLFLQLYLIPSMHGGTL